MGIYRLKFRCVWSFIDSLRTWPSRRHFADNIFKSIFENANELILPRISLKFVPKVRINNIPALVQIMNRRRLGDKPLSEPMMVSLLTHICVTRPQWVKRLDKRNLMRNWGILKVVIVYINNEMPFSKPEKNVKSNMHFYKPNLYSDCKEIRTAHWPSWGLNSTAIKICLQLLVQVNQKENIKAPHYWPFQKLRPHS